MPSRLLPRLTHPRRNWSPWRSIGLAVAVSITCVTGAVGVMHWSGPKLARQRWVREIEAVPQNELSGLLLSIARRDESTPLLVELLNHDRAEIALSARQAISSQLQRWQDLSLDEASRHVATLADLLAQATSEFRAPGRHLSAQLVDEVILWPLDDDAVDVAEVLADCELVLRNDPGPAGLLDIVSLPEDSRPTPLAALPAATRNAGSIPFPDWNVPPISGGGLPTEPYSPMESSDKAERLVDSPSGEPDAQPASESLEPPGEIYAPLAIPLRLAPMFGDDTNETSPIRSNQPTAIAQRPEYEPARLDDVELMRHLHDPAKSTLAEEQLRLRGFDNLRLEIARRLTHADPQVRKELANTLPQLIGIDARAWLEELAADRDPSVRKVAIAILGTSGDPSIETLLHQIRRDESNPQVAELIDGILERRR